MIATTLFSEDALPASGAGDFHRIGGGYVENLRLKPAEISLSPTGISVLKSSMPGEAAQQIRAAFPNATKLHELAKIVGSTTEKLILDAGFKLFPNPTKTFPNHYRITHRDGVAGFTEANLARLAEAFTNSSGH